MMGRADWKYMHVSLNGFGTANERCRADVQFANMSQVNETRDWMNKADPWTLRSLLLQHLHWVADGGQCHSNCFAFDMVFSYFFTCLPKIAWIQEMLVLAGLAFLQTRFPLYKSMLPRFTGGRPVHQGNPCISCVMQLNGDLTLCTSTLGADCDWPLEFSRRGIPNASECSSGVLIATNRGMRCKASLCTVTTCNNQDGTRIAADQSPAEKEHWRPCPGGKETR